LSIRLNVSLVVSERDLFSMETTMLKNIQNVLDMNIPISIKLSMFATVFQALEEKGKK
jgi:hypothetical protein